ncbi:hypothetical protein ACJJTC_007908 [Scirpophaga incertulas]
MKQLGLGISGFNRKPCLQNDLAMMLDSSSEDESTKMPEKGSIEAVLKKELLAYRTKKKKKCHREEFKHPQSHPRDVKKSASAIASADVKKSASAIASADVKKSASAIASADVKKISIRNRIRGCEKISIRNRIRGW